MKKTALKNMYILNGHEDMEAVKGKVILMAGGRIADIVDEENANLAGYEVVDLNGNYLLPGLINLHVHIPGSGKPKKGRSNYNTLAKLLKLRIARSVVKNMCANLVKDQLMSGTTTIRAVGGIMDFDTELRDKINSGRTIGPRILAANYAVSVPGGHMTGSVALPVNSPEEAGKMVDELAKSKPDLIKLMITGGILDAEVPGEPSLKMPPEIVRAACNRAHELGFMVAAHAESKDGIIVALENGVDTVEHGGQPSDETRRLFKDTGAALIATLSPALPFATMDQSVSGISDMDKYNGEMLFGYMVEGVKDALKNGTAVGLGTDTGCPYVTHYDMWRELYNFKKYVGVSESFAIHTATEINAKIAHIDDETGTVDIGKSADFMIVKENPLNDLAALRKPEMVVFKGEVISNPKAKHFENVDRELDKLM